MEPTEPVTPLPALPVLEYSRPNLVEARPLLTVPARVFHFYSAIILPIVCFAMSATAYPPGPEYQAGRWHDYLGLIPRAAVGWSFYPLLLFSMYAALMMVIRPAFAINRTHIRIGLFAGMILALQYSIIQVVCLMNTSDPATSVLAALGISVGSVAVLMFLDWLAGVLIWHRRWYRGRGKILFWCVPAVLVTGGLLISISPREPIIAVAFSQLVIAPLLTSTTFVSLSVLTLRRGVHPGEQLPGIIAWLIGWSAAFTAAWVNAYENAVIAYTALPTSRPGCYIATAAAQGHFRVVKSWQAGPMRMNAQLALFKAVEIALLRNYPRLHRHLRRIYDRVGPPVARRMQNRLIADLAYLTLKPIEWATVIVLLLTERIHCRGKIDFVRQGKP